MGGYHTPHHMTGSAGMFPQPSFTTPGLPNQFRAPYFQPTPSFTGTPGWTPYNTVQRTTLPPNHTPFFSHGYIDQGQQPRAPAADQPPRELAPAAPAAPPAGPQPEAPANPAPPQPEAPAGPPNPQLNPAEAAIDKLPRAAWPILLELFREAEKATCAPAVSAPARIPGSVRLPGPPQFTGKLDDKIRNVGVWAQDVALHAQRGGLSLRETLAAFTVGDAREQLDYMFREPSYAFMPDDAFCAAFVHYYQMLDQPRDTAARERLYNGEVAMSGSMTVHQYVGIFRQTVLDVGLMLEADKVQWFKKGLHSDLKAECQSDIYGNEFTSLDAIVQHAVAQELKLRVKKQRTAPKPALNMTYAQPADDDVECNFVRTQTASAKYPKRETYPKRGQAPGRMEKRVRVQEPPHRANKPSYADAVQGGRKILKRPTTAPGAPMKGKRPSGRDDIEQRWYQMCFAGHNGEPLCFNCGRKGHGKDQCTFPRYRPWGGGDDNEHGLAA